MIPVSQPVTGALEEELVLQVLRSGRLVSGPMVERFEDAVRQVVGSKHAIAVSSGTDALIAALRAHDIGPGDEVITSPFTFVATLNAILHVGATPRFVDIGDDGNLDTGRISAALSPATRAVLPVHLYGCPVDMEQLLAAAGPDVVVVEDAAQALGASQHGRAVGSFGTGCFSFYATKNVTTGEGGAVTTDDDEVAEVVRSLRNQGQTALYDYRRPGLNLRMTELQAALGVAQMTRLTMLIEARQSNARLLSAGLGGIDGLVTPRVDPVRRHVFNQFTIRITPDARLSRDELSRHLRSHGIDSAVYYPRPVYAYDCFSQDPRVGRPRTSKAHRMAGEVLSLPVHPRLREADVAHIVDVTRAALMPAVRVGAIP